MVSVRKRKMARSSVRKNTRRVKDKQRNINIHSNPIIAANWDKSLTLQQNYKRLGLRAKLGSMAGGAEQHVVSLTEIRAKRDKKNQEVGSDVDEDTEDPEKIPVGQAKIIRDETTNEVIKVIYGKKKSGEEEDEEKVKEDSEVVKQLQEYGKMHSQIKKTRHQSSREDEWLRTLYEKYGDDYEKMKWDKKLNIYQQTPGDLKRRINKWKRANNI
ncbi:Nucleolar protein 16 [Spathaspora sp. JA1]|nr:Nucleolar protein 16 [Spathaspora sp. JA1]